ncbi:hypothetical protein H4Q32_013885 [Labeo rohita]|uniref:Holliday junction regulator protein family C-terminal domain-containing protein n=1 Tax=Labeo rohita TaxID=84645 RepID=A0ABQ8LUG3_LABRO|nr:hypothetical protein H4Q32_013885 [Labeo rohita]
MRRPAWRSAISTGAPPCRLRPQRTGTLIVPVHVYECALMFEFTPCGAQLHMLLDKVDKDQQRSHSTVTEIPEDSSCTLKAFSHTPTHKLRNKGHNDCASPDPDDCFGHSPLMDDRFGKLNEESDLMYKRCGALNKKEHRGCDSPDPDASYVLTPHTEEKYKKINEEFDNMMRNHKIHSPQQIWKLNLFSQCCALSRSCDGEDLPLYKDGETLSPFLLHSLELIPFWWVATPGRIVFQEYFSLYAGLFGQPKPTALPPQNFSMHVAVPVTNPNAMSYNPGASLSSQSLSAAAAALSDGAMLSPPQGSLHRNVVSAGPPQRPPSTGSTG